MFKSTLLRAVLVCLTGVFLCASVGARMAGGDLASIFDNVHWTVGDVIAAVLTFEGWRRSRGTADETAARWFLGGMLAFLVGQLIWDAQVVADWLPFPGPSDVFYLLLGPGFTIGLWTIGRRRLSPTDWHAARLDAASLIAACVTASMALFLPEKGQYSLFQIFVLGAYPLTLIAPASLGLILLLTLRARLSWRSMLLPLATATLALWWVLWNLRFLHGQVINGDWLNLAFSWTAAACGLGAFMYRLEVRADSSWDRSCEGLLRVLPLLLVVVASVGIILANLPRVDPAVGVVTSLGGGLVVVLAAIRQSLLLRERDQLIAMERLLRQREQELELRVAERTKDLAHATEAANAANHAKSEFLANMSHEIRTPLNSVIGLAHVAMMNAHEPAQREHLERIQMSGTHLLRLIDDVLNMSKIEAGMIELEQSPFELHAVVRSLRNQTEHLAEQKGLRLRIDVAPQAEQAFVGDALRLGQVLINLTVNAIKFTERGDVTVSIAVADQNREHCRLKVDVRDTGIGMSAETVRWIFQPFHQADNSTTRRFGGTGLGLAICKQLVTLMGGEIGVDSEPGRGSHFWFTADIALSSDAQPGHPAATQPMALERLSGCRILLAEDNELNQVVATSMLQSKGAIVQVASTGREAIRALEAGSFDCVLMDVQMPDIDGLEVTRWAREQPRLAGLAIIAMTANARDEDRQSCLDAGMNDFVTKPVEPRRLFETVLRWLPTAHDGARSPHASESSPCE
jgi:signal transduction histidine kinase/ActR/RegA family two-component response regulator